MSRLNLIEQLYNKHHNNYDITKFNYDALTARPLYSLIPKEEINKLYKIATSIKYSALVDEKSKMIDEIMNRWGFVKAHAGTNRIVYNYLEDQRFVAKVAIDSVGMRDSPAEFINQHLLKPFCCKVFEVDPTGVIGIIERVNPISSIEEFLSVADNIYYMMVTKIIGRLVIDDVGNDKFMNYGVRPGFGPVLIDFPYVYELDPAKLICRNKINTPFGFVECMGNIDYDDGLCHITCTKCGKVYHAMDLAKDPSKTRNKIILNDQEGGFGIMNKCYIMKGDKVYKESTQSTTTYVSKDQYDKFVENKKAEKPIYAKYQKPENVYYETPTYNPYGEVPVIKGECGIARVDADGNETFIKYSSDNVIKEPKKKPNNEYQSMHRAVIMRGDEIYKDSDNNTINLFDTSNEEAASNDEPSVEEPTTEPVGEDVETESEESSAEEPNEEESTEEDTETESEEESTDEDQYSEDPNEDNELDENRYDLDENKLDDSLSNNDIPEYTYNNTNRQNKKDKYYDKRKGKKGKSSDEDMSDF